MTFITVLIGLLIERFFDWSHLRQWTWFIIFENTIAKKFVGYSSYIILAFSIIPILLLVVLLQLILHGVLYGFIKLIFQLVVLIYSMGPQNLWAEAYASIHDINKDISEDVEKEDNNTYTQSIHKHLLTHLFISGNRRVFAVVFWFVVLGPVGAVLYRLVTLSAADNNDQLIDPAISRDARMVEGVLDWLPVRLYTLLFALGGRFVEVFTTWRQKALLGLDSNETLITDCGLAAIQMDKQGNIPDDGTAEMSAVNLLDRVFILQLIILAIFSMLG